MSYLISYITVVIQISLPATPKPPRSLHLQHLSFVAIENKALWFNMDLAYVLEVLQTINR